MSKYSGKCDVYDTLAVMNKQGETLYETFLRSNLDLYDHSAIVFEDGDDGHTTMRFDTNKKLDITKPSELAEFYPYITVFLSACKDKSFAVLSAESWVEKEYKLYGDPYGVRDFYKAELAKEIKRLRKEEDPKYELDNH